jgi:ectoine hydroxylase-related dioxygenase (phytanoyl-CoA dioxygenase family)
MGSTIGSARRAFWDSNGYLVFPGFLDAAEVDVIEGAYSRAWTDMDPSVIVDDLVTNRRCRITDLDADERRHNFKVNDLYLIDKDLRQVALSARLGLILEDLLGDEPVVCNTLNFDKGSQQADHLDTLYMTPISDGGLVATWIALEDTAAGAGPLRYFPGSNQIDPYRFSTGALHQVDAEVPQWSDYMAQQVESRGLEEQRFLARKGDLFIWHAYLLHGGSKIEEPGLTRHSLVTHYWRQSDVNDWDLRPAPGGWWINKPPLQLPGEVAPAGPHAEEEVAEARHPATAHGADMAGGELHERLESLQYATD